MCVHCREFELQQLSDLTEEDWQQVVKKVRVCMYMCVCVCVCACVCVCVCALYEFVVKCVPLPIVLDRLKACKPTFVPYASGP